MQKPNRSYSFWCGRAGRARSCANRAVARAVAG